MIKNDERNEIIKAAEQGDAIGQYNLGDFMAVIWQPYLTNISIGCSYTFYRKLIYSLCCCRCLVFSVYYAGRLSPFDRHRCCVNRYFRFKL